MAHDTTKSNKNYGWKLVPHKAFNKVDPMILSQMKPLPKLERKDYKEYLRNNDINYDF